MSSPDPMGVVVIRPFVESDMEDVRAIKVPWVDYLNSSLDVWSRDPDRLFFVIQFNEKVVGFYSITLLDNGKTVWQESLRVAETHQGLGLVSALNRWKRDNLHKFPRISEAIISRFSKYIDLDVVAKPKHIVQSLSQIETERDLIHLFKFPVDEAKPHINPIKQVHAHDLYQHVRDHTNHHLILLSWTCWDMTPLNLVMLESGRYRPRYDHVTYHVGGNDLRPNKGFGRSYSIGCVSHIDSGPMYIAVVRTRDLMQLLRHVEYHVNAFKEDFKYCTLFELAFDVSLHYPFTKIMSLYQLPQYEWSVFEVPNSFKARL